MAVTLRDIAKTLNLSHATVSFVLNERLDVAIPDTTRQRVFQAAREMGYRPNRAARALVMGRTQMLALASPSVHRSPYGELFERFVAAARMSGYETLLTGLDKPIEWAVDAVLQIDAPRDLPRTPGLPTLRLDLTGLDPDADVRFDARNAGCLATEHLSDQGAKTLVLLAPPGALTAAEGAASGVRDVATERALTLHEVEADNFAAHSFAEKLGATLRNGTIPDAIVAVSTPAAIGAMRALTDAGIKVPSQCRIVVVDGDEALATLVPSISAVESPLGDLAVDAAEALLLTLRQNSQGGMIGPRIRQGKLVVRESSR